MTFQEFIRRYITVHKCGGCGEILDYKHSADAFCERCSLEWRSAIADSCPICFKSAAECACMPKTLSSSGALCLRRVFFYESEYATKPQMRIIFYLKERKSRRLTEFLARQILNQVRSETELLGTDPADFLVTFVPRGLKAYRNYGFDQSQLLSLRVAAHMGMESRRLFRSSMFTKEQKKLSKTERLENARTNIRLCSKADMSGKWVLLFDDMVTTGASMAACVELIRRAGAKGVLCFSVATRLKR